jgi:hypothetical protein
MKIQSMTVALLGLGLAAAPLLAAQAATGQYAAPGQPEGSGQMGNYQAQPARPGTVNYVEGTAYVDGQAINSKNVGSVSLEPGQVLSTTTGHAEVLLTPGVFLRMDPNSAVKMISPNLVQTQVEIDKGRAGIEVDEIHKQNNLQIVDAGVTTRLEKTGYYEFNANNPEVMVFKGKADVEVADGKGTQVKGNHDLTLAQTNVALSTEKPAGMDGKSSQDELYNWSRLRSEYVAEANNQMAGYYGGAGYDPGWYWDPYLTGYTFLGAGPFYSPFGWGFYPLGWGWGGWYGGYYGRGFYGHGGYYHGGYRGGYRGGEFAHGGGMGGGFHGGGGAHGR